MRSDLVSTHSISGVAHPSRAAVLGRVGQVVDYLFGLLYALFLVRLALEFFGARPGAGFVQFIRNVTDYFYAPFRGIFATTSVDGAHLVWPLVVALLAYMLLHGVIRGLLGLLARM
jgi:uncharacterized protein YggT (Ycf19 family)